MTPNIRLPREAIKPKNFEFKDSQIGSQGVSGSAPRAQRWTWGATVDVRGIGRRHSAGSSADHASISSTASISQTTPVLRPYLFNLDGSQEKSCPNLFMQPLDEIYWVGGSGLALAAFGTKGNYYKPEREDRRSTLALADGRNGTILQSKDDIPELADQKALVAVASQIDGFGKVHVIIT
ncbi:hypothetical protein EHI44_30565 [Rhizobium leguminosarum]|uniref:hypothetical protein n=1 Tax=Rhizobium leguminosarum TaxID=384 RepID=UPI000FEE8063|nr:hypothetical protein [Rhizobium leguminosarum]RWY79874.1 hypothetical protein EHI44_30565 [Rhizobium leguminosarum]